MFQFPSNGKGVPKELMFAVVDCVESFNSLQTGKGFQSDTKLQGLLVFLVSIPFKRERGSKDDFQQIL